MSCSKSCSKDPDFCFMRFYSILSRQSSNLKSNKLNQTNDLKVYKNVHPGKDTLKYLKITLSHLFFP